MMDWADGMVKGLGGSSEVTVTDSFVLKLELDPQLVDTADSAVGQRIQAACSWSACADEANECDIAIVLDDAPSSGPGPGPTRRLGGTRRLSESAFLGGGRMAELKLKVTRE